MSRNFDSPVDDFQTGSFDDQSEFYSWDGDTSDNKSDNNQNDFSWDDESSSSNYADFSSENYNKDYTGNEQNSEKSDFVNYKGTGVIIAIIFVLLAFIFLFFNSIKITKNDVSKPKSTEQEQQVSSNVVNENTAQKDAGVVNLLEIPTSTSLDYSGDIYESNGTIVDKVKYLQGHQVVYCLTVRLALGSASEDIKYYCNYASFSSVSNGDLVIVKYQQVQDGYISVNEITK